MILTPRDLLILEKLSSFGVLSTAQIGKVFFPNVAMTTVRKRLRILEEKEMIFRVSGLEGGASAWAISQKAVKKIGVVHFQKHFNRNTITHDVTLSEVRLVLENVSLAQSWTPEHVLKSQNFKTNRSNSEDLHLIPDALFSVVSGTQNRVIALELELNGKHSKRYKNIFSNYKLKKSIWAVWYLVKTKTHGTTLQNVWRGVNGGNRNDLFMWSILDELFQDPYETKVHSEHFSFYLKEIVSMKKRYKTPALGTALGESRENLKNHDLKNLFTT